MSHITRTREGIRSRYTELTHDLRGRSYDVQAWAARGEFFRSCDYHDLAVGDFYKALLLTDDALDTSGEYHQQALSAHGFDTETNANDGEDDLPEAVSGVFKGHAMDCCVNLVDCLLELGALKSAHHFCELGLGMRVPDNPSCTEAQAKLLAVKAEKFTIGPGQRDDLEDAVQARRELYPWNDHEPDRYSPESIDMLNSRLEAVAAKCVVKSVELPLLHDGVDHKESNPILVKQLGLFAKEDIAPGETVLQEKSLLAVNNQLHDELCDACSSALPANSAQAHACEECMTAIFCSQECLEEAMEAYHPAVCGNEDFEAMNKDVDPKQASDALYDLLLGRAVAMAETKDVHPLDLIEVAYLWGDYSIWEEPSRDDHKARPRTLPWTFEHNIAGPIHMLTVLDLDIFAAIDKYDFWILNTLSAKFRGVANARMNARTGRPEVAASHYRWCLANHSCASNVTWEWGGEIKMWARDGAKDEVVRWGEDKEATDGRWRGGLKAGDEILNHYCDIGLPVKERREWAAGALGGVCMCNRCVWEAAHERS